MNSSHTRIVQFVLFLVLGAGLTVWVFMDVDLNLIWEQIAKAQWIWVILAVLLTFAGHLSRAARWRLLLRAAGNEASLRATWVALMTGYFVNLGLPRLGEITRWGLINRLSGVPVLAAGGTVVAERATDLLTLILLAGITLLSAGEQLSEFIRQSLILPTQQAMSGKLFILSLLALFAVGFLVLLYLFVQKPKPHTLPSVLDRLRAAARALWDGLLSAFRMRQWPQFILHTVVIWLSYYAAPLLTMKALGLTEIPGFYGIAFAVFVVGSLARTLPLPAGSMGAYHLLVTALLMAYGYTETEGLAVATLNHAVQTLFYVVMGLVALALGGWMLRAQAVPADRKSE